MYNPDFGKSLIDGAEPESYIVPKPLINIIQATNRATHMRDKETKTADIYTQEIQRKLQRLDISNNDIDGKVLVDICCGTGFLSYHLLKLGYRPSKLILADISDHELDIAYAFISQEYPDVVIQRQGGDILESTLGNDSIDMVIGYSFLHHFYDIPYALRYIYKILRTGGSFVLLHEPTVAALPIEYGSVLRYGHYLLRGNQYIEDMRYGGEGIRKGGGSDVWLFVIDEINTLFGIHGFDDIVIKPYNLILGFVMNKLGRSKKDPIYSQRILSLFGYDETLSTYLSKNMFGGLYMKGIKQ